MLVQLDDENYGVGLILQLFESVGDEPHRAKIKWYFKDEELPARFRSSKYIDLCFSIKGLFCPGNWNMLRAV